MEFGLDLNLLGFLLDEATYRQRYVAAKRNLSKGTVVGREIGLSTRGFDPVYCVVRLRIANYQATNSYVNNMLKKLTNDMSSPDYGRFLGGRLVIHSVEADCTVVGIPARKNEIISNVVKRERPIGAGQNQTWSRRWT